VCSGRSHCSFAPPPDPKQEQVMIDAHLAELIDYNSDLATAVRREIPINQRGFAGPKKTRNDNYGSFAGIDAISHTAKHRSREFRGTPVCATEGVVRS
jgi:hypothetical protein